MRSIYLDHNATTPVLPQVQQAMASSMENHFGNPSSLHWAGQATKRDMDIARTQVSQALDCRSDEVVFLSGATEANNWVLQGMVLQALQAGKSCAQMHVITTAIEHKSVLSTCDYLESLGVKITRIEASPSGVVNPADIAQACTENTLLISVMAVNNDTGVIQPLAEIAAVAKARKIKLHCDAVQAMGKMPFYPRKLGVDFASFSAHKFGGPKGIGGLFQRNGFELPPLIYGGKQELVRRAGTENVPGIVGMGLAAEMSQATHTQSTLADLRDLLQQGILELDPQACIVGAEVPRIANTLLVRFVGREGLAIVINLDLEGIAVSVGSACSAGDQEPSHVLRGMGYAEAEALEGVRFSLGPQNSQEDVQQTLQALAKVLRIVKVR